MKSTMTTEKDEVPDIHNSNVINGHKSDDNSID